MARFVGCTRPGYDMSAGTLESIPADRVTILEIPALAISSTECRERRAKGEPVWYLVPDGVVQYIAKHDLYGPPRASHAPWEVPHDRHRARRRPPPHRRPRGLRQAGRGHLASTSASSWPSPTPS